MKKLTVANNVQKTGVGSVYALNQSYLLHPIFYTQR
jgi:hypothetical protein